MQSTSISISVYTYRMSLQRANKYIKKSWHNKQKGRRIYKYLPLCIWINLLLRQLHLTLRALYRINFTLSSMNCLLVVQKNRKSVIRNIGVWMKDQERQTKSQLFHHEGTFTTATTNCTGVFSHLHRKPESVNCHRLYALMMLTCSFIITKNKVMISDDHMPLLSLALVM